MVTTVGGTPVHRADWFGQASKPARLNQQTPLTGSTGSTVAADTFSGVACRRAVAYCINERAADTCLALAVKLRRDQVAAAGEHYVVAVMCSGALER
jgi:hypothetical protein